MNRHDHSNRQGRYHRFGPSFENLETRRLPSFFGSFGYSSNQVYYQAQVVRHEYDTYVSALKQLELQSRATPAEFLALRNDARAISAAASPQGLSPAAVQYKAVEVSLQLDRSPLYGWLDDAGWTDMSTRLTANLSGLNVPQSIISQTVADMRTLAVSAGVDPFGFDTFTNDFTTLRNGEQTLPSGYGYHFEDPSLYYTQHLRGFFRNWGVQKVESQAKLQKDLHTIQAESQSGPTGAAVVGRDVRILQGLGSAVPSTVNQELGSTYVAAFAQAVARHANPLAALVEPRDDPRPVRDFFPGQVGRSPGRRCPGLLPGSGPVGIQRGDDRR